MAIVLYGHPASQPSRAVYWTCLIRGLPFELHPDFAAIRAQEFASLNPKRQLPTLVDGDVTLYEMPAILGYLCDKFGWSDLYPDDLVTRARINQYLHFHHSTTRLATARLMAPHVTVAFEGGVGDDSVDLMVMDAIRRTMASPDKLSEGQSALATVADLIERGYFAGSGYLCGTGSPTIADIACYEELAQLPWAGLFDFGPWPKLSAWLQSMQDLPAHEIVHRYNMTLGDINVATPNTMERFVTATEAALAVLTGCDGVTVVRGA